MSTIDFYGTQYCPYCIRAKALLEQKQAAYNEIRVDLEPSKRAEMQQRGGGRTVPQIFINGVHIGGCDELYALERQGGLDPLLQQK